MKQLTLKLSSALLLALSVGFAEAQNPNSINVVTSAVPFLRISPDARAGGMGDVGIATSPDANSSFWNLAKTPFATSRSSLTATYTPWLKDLGLNDVYLASLAGYYKLDDDQAISSSIRYFSLGNIQFTDFAGNDLQSFRPREFSIDFGYSRRLGEKLSAGVALRYINSNLAGGQAVNGVSYKAGNAVAGDLSLFHSGVDETGAGWNWGATLSNLGTKISYTSDAQQKDYIPANLGLGAAYTSVFDETSKLTFGADVNKLLVPTPPSLTNDPTRDDANLLAYRNKTVINSWFSSFGDAGSFGNELKEFQASLGAEYTYNDQFAFRAGYFYEDKLKGNRKYFTLGAGIYYNVFGLNFSYLIPSGNGVNRNPLSNTLRFSLVFDLDKEGGMQ
ncbi:type IX secretion system outer membrane channel protein PorV [Segetibacter sp. 3557_3]|uniref:type IX secretion system outer membrane channel protein PorV n=1 Tax=Segetibacter sp. 3557_3 TaxID=2547429 RepID=UPI001058F2C1|nr:type IX secretion system outer membrane channel protein PorV [Segetibacter sp. 3557_3]TDH26558.1 type IX secretion system outer membrane channel protein PorV [Segetibacter sp. 3557_3]